MRKSIFLLLTAFSALALGGCWDKSGDKAASVTTDAPANQAAPMEATPPQPPEAPGAETPQVPQPPTDVKPVPEENMAAPKPGDEPQANASGSSSTVPPISATDTVGSAGRIVGDQTRAQASIESSERAQTGTRPSARPNRPTHLAAASDDVTNLHENMPKVVDPQSSNDGDEQASEQDQTDTQHGPADATTDGGTMDNAAESLRQEDGSIKIPDTGQTKPDGTKPDMVVPTVPSLER